MEKNRSKDFKGLWINEDNKTRGVSKCKISFKNNRFVVQMWVTSHPQDCDWGKKNSNELETGSSKFEILWDHNFTESLVTYEIIDGKLKVTDKRHYKDNSEREDFTSIEYFTKK